MLASSISDVITHDDVFRPVFEVLGQITMLSSRNMNDNLEESQLERLVQSMLVVTETDKDLVKYKYRETLIDAISYLYLGSLGNKPKSRKSEKVLHIVSGMWHTELLDKLHSHVIDLMSSHYLTSDQLMKVSHGLDESELFREAIDKNLPSLLTHINQIFINISGHFSCQSGDSSIHLKNPVKEADHRENPVKEADHRENPVKEGDHVEQGPRSQDAENLGGSRSPVHHMDLCYTCVKVCLQVFQYFPKSVGGVMWEATPTCQPIPLHLINSLQSVLSQRYSKDCNLIAGSALAMLLNTTPTITQAMSLIQLLSNEQHDPVKIGSVEITSLSHDLKDGPYFKIALIRGILTCCKPRLLLSTRGNEDSVLLHSLFAEVVSICQSPNHSVLYNAFQLLVYWFESVIATLDQYVTARPVPERKTCFHIDSPFVKNTLQLIWENWQNPLSGVPAFVKMTFGLLLEIHRKESQLFGICSSVLYNSLASHLLQISWHVKGRYALLCSLVPYVGALHLLSDHPTLPRQLIRGLAPNFLSSAVSDLHRVLLQTMAKEIDMADGAGEEVDAALRWKHIWGDCVVDVLCSEQDLVRFHGAQYWLPRILKCFPGAYELLITSLDAMSSPHAISSKRRLHAVVMVMAEARQADIINFTEIEKNMSLISKALYHVDDDIRLHALTLICNSPRKAEAVNQLELDMLRRFLPRNLNCDGASFRQKMHSYIKVIITRIRDSCLASLKILNKKESSIARKTDEKEAEAENNLLSGITFLDWLLLDLMRSLFPGACYQRKRAALGLIAIIYEVMLSKGQCNKKKGKTPETTSALIKWAHHRNKCNFICERHCSLLLECLLDGSNDIRDLAYRIISTYFPWPLLGPPTAASEEETCGILSQGLQLISSPKSPECEAGSKLCMLAFQRHILEGKDAASRLVGTYNSMTIELCNVGPEGALPFLRQLTEILVHQYKCCSGNILKGSFTTPMHGVLLTIRNCLTINSPALRQIMLSDPKSWSAWIRNLIDTSSDIVTLAMSVLSSRIRGTELSPSFADIGEGIDDLVVKMGDWQMRGEEVVSEALTVESGEENPAMSTSHQLIMACCWLNLKEVSLVLGELSQFVLIVVEREDGLLTRNQLHKMTDMFVNILTKCRHRGAIEGCNLGFTRLCSSLLSSPSHELSTIPRALLQDVIHLITNEGSTSSFTKKSAGLPLLVEAVINSEPRGREKTLLQITMTSLLKIAQEPEPIEHDPKVDLPQCHSLNMLKALFRSAAINDDVMPYASRSVIVAINGFASKHFSIRNGSMLLFGSLVARMFGQKRVQDEHSRVNSMTAREFFVHYPELQNFLLQEICKCIHQQVAGNKSLHPSLFPVLIILSKLGCGMQSGDTSVLAQFIQPVMQLSASPVYQVRVLAAEALVPLVAEDKILVQVMHIINLLPKTRKELNSQNQLHGRLLQIQKLFHAHMDNTLGLSSSSDAHSSCSRLCELKWIGSEENNCPLTRAVFIETITTVVAWLLNDKTNISAIRLGDEICNIAKNYLTLQHTRKIADVILTKSMVNSMLLLNRPQMLENLKLMLNSGSPDIILQMQRFLLEQLEEGEDIQCYESFLQELLDLINSKHSQTSLLESSLKLFVEVTEAWGHRVVIVWTKWWDRLLELANGVQGVSVCCAALPALGVVVKGMFSECPTLRCDLKSFCRLLVINSEPTRSETSRLAVASSLKIVGADILKEFQYQKDEDNTVHTMSIFTAASNLLQDEQSEVRCQAARFVSRLSEEITDEELETVQPSYALQMLIKYMCRNFKWSSSCLSDLCQQLFGSSSVEIEIKHQTMGTVNLFEQDDANIYCEPAQLATYIHRELLVLVTSLTEDDPKALKNLIIEYLPDTNNQMRLLHKQLSEKTSSCGSFFGISGLSKPYCLILRKLLQVHLLMFANSLLSRDSVSDLSDLHRAASDITKIKGLHPLLQDQLRNIIDLT